MLTSASGRTRQPHRQGIGVDTATRRFFVLTQPPGGHWCRCGHQEHGGSFLLRQPPGGFLVLTGDDECGYEEVCDGERRDEVVGDVDSQVSLDADRDHHEHVADDRRRRHQSQQQ